MNLKGIYNTILQLYNYKIVVLTLIIKLPAWNRYIIYLPIIHCPTTFAKFPCCVVVDKVAMQTNPEFGPWMSNDCKNKNTILQYVVEILIFIIIVGKNEKYISVFVLQNQI